MLAAIKTEFLKLKRYHILLVGVIGMVCSPLLQLFSQAIMVDEAKTYTTLDLPALLELTLWGNAQIFMPVIFTLIGGYIVNREFSDDTLKNILTVPISFRRLLLGKLCAMGLLAGLLGVYGFTVTLVIGWVIGLQGFTAAVLLRGFLQMVGLALCIYLVVLPILTVCGRKPGLFMGGSVAAFLAGYSCLFFKTGILRSIYPFSAALTVIGFDSSSYIGAAEKGSLLCGIASLGVMLLFSVLLLYTAKGPKDEKQVFKITGKNFALRAAQQERQKANLP